MSFPTLEDQWSLISRGVEEIIPEDELKNRLMERAKVSGRPDDADPEIIQNRINTYNQNTAPVADFYAAQGKLHEIDGVGSIDDITSRLYEAVDQ